MSGSDAEREQLSRDYADAKRIADPAERKRRLEELIPRARGLTGTMSSTIRQILDDINNAQREIDKNP